MSSEATRTVRFNMLLTPDEDRMLRELAAADGLSASDEVRLALRHRYEAQGLGGPGARIERARAALFRAHEDYARRLEQHTSPPTKDLERRIDDLKRLAMRERTVSTAIQRYHASALIDASRAGDQATAQKILAKSLASLSKVLDAWLDDVKAGEEAR